MKGLVIKSTGKNYLVKRDDTVYDCVVRGKIRLKGFKSTNPIAVGDYVDFDGDDEVKVINKIHERKNHLVRKSVNLSKQQHVIAANIDLAILIISESHPITFPAFIDRFLVSAEAFGIETNIVLNKWDLLNEEDQEWAEMKMEYYSAIGYKTNIVSAETGYGLEELKSSLADKTVIFSGHSGVGKTSLLNKLQPGLKLRTGDISDIHDTGMHTTTNAEMIFTDFGARIIDSPGIKGFGLIGIDEKEIKNYFRDFRPYAGQCHFHNCIHISEPKCAVKEAVENHEILDTRYQSYVNMVQKDDDGNHFRTNIYGG